MKKKYFHGSSIDIQGSLQKGTCVSSSKSNALIFARRRQRGNCYIYTLLLDPAVDLKQHVDAVETVDYVLARDTPFSERIVVTDQVIAKCKAVRAADIADLS
jgi:hypothetical protein